MKSKVVLAVVLSLGLFLALSSSLVDLSNMARAWDQALQGQIATLEARLAAVERAVGAKDTSTRALGLPAGWLLLGGLFVAGLVLGQRWRAGGGR